MEPQRNNDLVINFRIKKEDGDLFKHYCIDNETTMSELLRKLIDIQLDVIPGKKTFGLNSPVGYINNFRHIEQFKDQNFCFYENTVKRKISNKWIRKLKELAKEFWDCGFWDFAVLLLDLANWQKETDIWDNETFSQFVNRYYELYLPTD